MAEKSWWEPLIPIAGQTLQGWLLGGEDDDWRRELEVQKQLWKLRNRLPPRIYNALVQMLTRPSLPHGAGQATSGSFRNLVEGTGGGTAPSAPISRFGRRPTEVESFLTRR